MNQSRCEDVSRLFCYLEEPKMRNCVLILEPDAGVSRFMQLKLEEEGFNCLTDNTGDSAVDLAGQRQVDIILLDPDSAPRNGMELLGKVREISSIPIIYLSSDSSVDTKVAVLNAGADDYITKPYATKELVARIRSALIREQSYPFCSITPTTEDGTTLPGRTPEVNIFVPYPKEDNIFCAIRLRHMSLLLTNKIFIAIPIFKFNNYFHSSLLT